MSEDQNPNTFKPNRAQRRAMRKTQLESVPVEDLVLPPQMTNEQVKDLMLYRIQLNAGQTRHPLHHLTANGTIVDADPTLEYCMNRLSRIPEHKQYMRRILESIELLVQAATDAPKAVPVNRKFYGRDPYAVH